MFKRKPFSTAIELLLKLHSNDMELQTVVECLSWSYFQGFSSAYVAVEEGIIKEPTSFPVVADSNRDLHGPFSWNHKGFDVMSHCIYILAVRRWKV